MPSADFRLAAAAERIADALEYFVSASRSFGDYAEKMAASQHVPEPAPPEPVAVGEVPAGGGVPPEIVKELVDSGLMKEPVGGMPEPVAEAEAPKVKVYDGAKR